MAVQRSDPYPSANFLVEIDGIGSGGFAEVGGLQIATDVVEYREGNDKTNAVRKLTGLTRYADVTLRRGIVGSLDLYQWIRDSADGSADAARNVAIVLLDEAHQPVLRWLLRRARIVRYTGGPLNAKSSDVAVEEMVLAFDRLELE